MTSCLQLVEVDTLRQSARCGEVNRCMRLWKVDIHVQLPHPQNMYLIRLGLGCQEFPENILPIVEATLCVPQLSMYSPVVCVRTEATLHLKKVFHQTLYFTE